MKFDLRFDLSTDVSIDPNGATNFATTFAPLCIQFMPTLRQSYGNAALQLHHVSRQALI
jgi:hypothetical protein